MQQLKIVLGGRRRIAPENLVVPTSRFRMAWDALKEVAPARANRRYLEILQLAAQEGEVRVDEALHRLLSDGEIGEGKLNAEAVKVLLNRQLYQLPAAHVTVAEVTLEGSDELLGDTGPWNRYRFRHAQPRLEAPA